MPHPAALRRVVATRGARPFAGSVLVAAVVLFFAAGCGDDPTGPDPNAPLPDFTLQDVNPNSATGSEPVSPRQQLGRVSAWYFGHAT